MDLLFIAEQNAELQALVDGGKQEEHYGCEHPPCP